MRNHHWCSFISNSSFLYKLPCRWLASLPLLLGLEESTIIICIFTDYILTINMLSWLLIISCYYRQILWIWFVNENCFWTRESKITNWLNSNCWHRISFNICLKILDLHTIGLFNQLRHHRFKKPIGILKLSCRHTCCFEKYVKIWMNTWLCQY